MLLVKFNENFEVTKYPYTFYELRADNPTISFPEEHQLTNAGLADYFTAIVVGHDIPEYTIYQDVYEINPQMIDGEFHQSYSIVDKPQAEKDFIKQSAQAAVWEQIQYAREEEKMRGVIVNGYQFHGNDSSRIQYLGLNALGGNFPTGIMWKTRTGAFIEMTETLVQQIISAIAIRDNEIFLRGEEHRAAMLLLDNPYHYDFSDWGTPGSSE